MKATKITKISKSELKRLQESLKSVCMIYSDFQNTKRRESFGKSMFERLNNSLLTSETWYRYSDITDNCIVYKGAQWGGKWGNFYKAIYFRNGEFHFGSGFSNKQILL